MRQYLNSQQAERRCSMTLVTRYTFKELRIIKGLTFEQVSNKTAIPVDQIKAIEKDSSDIKPTVYKKLSKLYDIDTNYICIGEQSYLEKLVLDKFMQSEIYQKASLSKKLTPIEVAKLEKKLGLNEFSLFQAILDISKEGDNEQPT
jgi:transcriptional regulator with XRE-family HTH domain